MNRHKPSSNAQACGAQVASEASTQPQYQQIKLALDVHAASIVVSRMLEGAKPQPPQTFKPADFLAWVTKQAALAKEVISCYEAGPTGFWLHRKLTALRESNHWWKADRWKRLKPELAAWLVERLKVFRDLIVTVDRAVRQLTGELEAKAPTGLPKGMGRLTYHAVETEVAAWDRFKNRRQVGSYAGLTGGVTASGQSSADLSISSPLAYQTGRGRPASATGCPVSFVPMFHPT
jgi:hypothetical protein